MTTFAPREYLNIPAKSPERSPRFDDLVWQRMAAAPDATAVLGAGGNLSYADLVGQAEGLALQLRDAGCQEGDVVALFLDRSPELLVAVLAVLRVGATCLPVAPTDPTGRVELLLDDIDPQLVVTSAALVSRLPSRRTTVLVEDGSPAPVVPRPARPATAPAVIFSTSGSTGKPKPVVITHHNYTSQLDWVIGNFGLSAADVHLLKAPVSFVSLLRQVIWPLATGAATVIVEGGREHDIPYHARLIDEHQVTFTTFITPALQAFIRYARLDGGSMRGVATGGDRYPIGLARGFFRTFPNARMHHTYGMTEGTLVLCALIDSQDADETSLGIVVPGAVARLLDETGAPVGPGGTGEVYIGGVPLTPGYLRRPELNAERFIPSQDGPLFATRDRARLREDGTFELIGRSDNMVKIRGYRVELGEVENAIGTHPAVAQAVCRADIGPNGDTRLVAYLLMSGTASDEQLRQYLRSTLRDYMVPGIFVRLHAFPLTPNGKVKRDELPDPSAVVAGTTVAGAVHAEWARVLELASPSPTGHFLDLGGNSMTAMELAANLTETLGIEIPVTGVLDHPTLAEFTAYVETVCMPPTPANRPNEHR